MKNSRGAGNFRAFSTFGSYHPLLNFLWFCAVILLSMFLLHPVCMGISAVCAAFYAVWLGGRKTVKFILGLIIPLILLVSLINPLVSHEGVTILTYLGDNPITLEAVLYGIVSGFMFAAVLLWFSCYNVIMTSDKFVYLFGKIIPSISMVFSMVLRFVPRFKAQIKKISQAQKCVGRDAGSGNLRQRAGHGLKILSIMVTWALENAIDTADSMKSRGYGLKGRNAFSIYRFDARDAAVTLLAAAMLIIVLIGAFAGACGARYYPYLELSRFGSASAAVFGAYFVLCSLPVILDVKEALQWRHLQSKI